MLPAPSSTLNRTRASKADLLQELKHRGDLLIDLKEDPVDAAPLTNNAPNLFERVRRLNAAKIIMIKATVHDAAFPAVANAGLPLF